MRGQFTHCMRLNDDASQTGMLYPDYPMISTNVYFVISTEGRLNRRERFEQPMAGPKGVGQEARSKSPWIQEISHITTCILPYAFRASSDYGFYLTTY